MSATRHILIDTKLTDVYHQELQSELYLCHFKKNNISLDQKAAKTIQDNSSTESKVTLVAFKNNKKCLIAFGEIFSSQSKTALCSAVLAQSATDAIVSTIPWPVPGHQRLDGPSESAGCLAARKKTLKKHAPYRFPIP